MRLRLLLVLSIVLAFGVAASVASAGSDPSSPRKLCTKGHWQQNGFKSEDKCMSYLQFVEAKCRSVGGTFGVDNQVTFVVVGHVLWTCNGDGLTIDFATTELFPDCLKVGTGAAFQGDASAMTCFRT
jgi:hypothetical protein